MPDITVQQALLSEDLLLLNKFYYLYADPESLPFPKTLQIELDLLDAIASVLTTRNGDTFAAAFDQGNGFLELILTKSGKLTMDDKQFAKDFLARIFDPDVQNATDLFPFLLEHRRDYLNMRIKKLHAIATDPDFNKYFHSNLDYYVARCTDPSPEVQFPRRHANFCKEKSYDSLLKEYLIKTQEYSKRDLDESVSEAHDAFFNLWSFSETLADSAFMRQLVIGYGRNVGRKVVKFIRHAEKLGRYIRGVKCILKYAKRLFTSGSTIPHRWIEDNLTGTGEGEVQFQAENAYEVVCRARETNPLPAKHSENLNKVYPSNREPWQPLSAYLHPEIRLILSSLAPREGRSTKSRAIGLSKQPCMGCMVWIKYYNLHMSTSWVTNGFWGKPDPTFALPGGANPVNSYDMENFGHKGNYVDPYVGRDVHMKLVDELPWFLKRGLHYK